MQRHEVPEAGLTNFYYFFLENSKKSLGPSVLIMASSEELCKQLQELIKSGNFEEEKIRSKEDENLR